MANIGESRFRLYQQFEEGIGSEMATVLMEHLDTFATKQDIADLRAEMVTRVEFIEFKAQVAAEFAEVKVAIANLETKLHDELRTTALVLVGTNVALICVAAAFVRFA